MEFCKLYRSELEISAMSMGTWGFSGDKQWGESDDAVAVRTLHAAMDSGINLFDTAAKYGGGKAEAVLGKALRGRRTRALVATKANAAELGYEAVIHQCEESLTRLGTDYIDLYQIHWPSERVPVEETLSAFETLKQQGKIREIGVCNHGTEALQALDGHRVATNQLPYSLLWRLVEGPILEETAKRKMTVWAYSPLAQGLLTGKFRSVEEVPLGRRNTRFYSGKWQQGRHNDTGFETEVFAFLPKLQAVADQAGVSMTVLALAFLRSRAQVGSVLIGSRNPEQLEQNLKAFETKVPQEVLAEVDRLSLALRAGMGENPDLWENENGGRMH